MTSPAEETPWAMVVRMRAENARFEAIVEGLKAKGLERDDIELLLKGSPELSTIERPRPPRTTSAGDDALTLSTEVGSPLRWTGLTLTGFAAMIGAAGLGQGALWGAIVCAIAAAGFTALLIPELRSGLRRTAKKLGYLLFFVGAVPSVLCFIDSWKLWQTVFVAGFALSIPMILWASRTGARLRGIADFAPTSGALFESNEVQFTIVVPEKPQCAPGEAIEIRILAQNCVDVPRTLVVEISGRSETIIGEKRHTFPVDPGAIVELLIPVRLHGLAPEFVTLVIDIAGLAAAPGRRVRLEKGAEYVTSHAALSDNLLGLITFAAVGFASSPPARTERSG